jgi:uncharacterized phage-associated protein
LGRLSGWELSNLEIQKIAYIAEMLHLGREGEPLIAENWQAWSYGPVQPDLYHKAKIFGADPVKDIFIVPPLKDGGTKHNAVNDAYDLMASLTPGQMIEVTHRPNGAWAATYIPGVRGRVIPKEAIREEYDELIEDDA